MILSLWWKLWCADRLTSNLFPVSTCFPSWFWPLILITYKNLVLRMCAAEKLIKIELE